jgi:streptogramin lyase
MSDLKSLLDRALDGFEPAPGGLEGTLVRVRRRRRRRVGLRAAGALVVIGGLVLALVIVAGHRDRRISTPPATPVVPPTVQAVTTTSVPGGLTDVAVGDGSIWLPGVDVVQRFDARTGRLQRRIPVRGASDRRYVAVGAGGVWVTDTGTQQVTRIDPSTDRVVATVTLGASPDGVKVASGVVWVSYTRPTSSRGRGDTGIVIIDPHTNRAGAPIQFSRTGPTELVVGDGRVWVSDGFTVADAIGHHLHTELHLPPGQLQLVAAGDHSLWFLPGDRSGLVRLDTTGITNPAGRPFSVSLAHLAIPQAVQVAATRRAVWVLTNRNDAAGSRPGQLIELDPTSLRVVGTPITVGTTPVRVIATDTSVWVANFSEGTITKIELRAPSAATTRPAGWSTARDLADGLSISYPRPWRPAASTLTPVLVDPKVPIALGTYPLQPQRLGECDIVPQRALEALGPRDAFVAIYVYDGMATGDFSARRPARFGPGLPWLQGHIQCTQNVHGHIASLNFTDQGRHLSVLVAYGENASTKRQRELYRILDTLTVTPAS